MTRERRFVYYYAASADGFLARADGRVDWLEARPAEDYGAAEFFASIDTIVWGRRTFEGYGLAPGALDAFGPVRHVVLSTRAPSPARPLPERVTFASDARALVAKLRNEPGKDVWVMGGAASASALLDAGGLDEVFVHVIPILLKDGMPPFVPHKSDHALKLLETRAFPDGVVRLRYALEGST